MFGTREFSRWCFVDIETTGLSPARAGITEIGVVTVDVDGGENSGQARVAAITEWSSLLNPGRPIPPGIQRLTGITDAMVRAAPRFADLAESLHGRLRDAVLVAHNARFDYGFLKVEFERAGLAWQASTLCTVRLSRLLYPDRGPHSLDAIVARFGLDGEQRHRALGDARVLWRLLRALYARHPGGEVDAAIERALTRPHTLPAT
jgi:DNA polymerase-3 subunit epsilon